jgi:hypothetical protein
MLRASYFTNHLLVNLYSYRHLILRASNFLYFTYILLQHLFALELSPFYTNKAWPDVFVGCCPIETQLIKPIL